MDIAGLSTSLAWSLVPPIACAFAQRFLYQSGLYPWPVPADNTPQWQRDRKYIHTAVIIGYLAYTIYDAEQRRSVNFYDLVGLQIPNSLSSFDLKALKARFRKLSLQYHPDKAGAAGEQYYLQLRLAHDVLADPARRFAYERFGPQSVSWRGVQSIRDYIQAAVLYRIIPEQVGTLGIMVFLDICGQLQYGRYWRFVLYFFMLAYEIIVITRPYHLTFIPWMSSFQLPFEHLQAAHKLAISFAIVLNQLGPLYSAPPENIALDTALTVAEHIAEAAEKESLDLAKDDLRTLIANNENQQEGLRRELEEFLFQNQVDSHPSVQPLIKELMHQQPMM